MLAKMTNATYNTQTGRVLVNLDTSLSVGYPNTCEQFQSYGFISVPLPGQLVAISQQSVIQVQVTGYNNQVNDTNFSLNPGESSQYGQNWYGTNAINGMYLQQAQSTNAENMMMGQSTNSVLEDILNYLVGLEGYIAGHVHSGCGGTSDSGPPTTSPPDTSDLSNDATYIAGNKNLAITGTYMPKLDGTTLSQIFAKLKGLA